MEGADGDPVEDEHKTHFSVVLSSPGPDDVEITSFKGLYSPWGKSILFYILGVLLAGLPFLASYWSLPLRCWLKLKTCPIKDATFVRIKLADGRTDIQKVQFIQRNINIVATHRQNGRDANNNDVLTASLLPSTVTRANPLKLITYKCGRFFYVESIGTYIPLPATPPQFDSNLQNVATSLSSKSDVCSAPRPGWDVKQLQLRYGLNMMEIPVKSVLQLMGEEMWHPFYVFQYTSIFIWVFGDQYYSYSVCIFLITWFSITSSALETHRNLKRLAQIAKFERDVEVIRGGRRIHVGSAALVPGDLIMLSTGAVPADLVLVRGEAIVDENMLTGESVPVRKVAYSVAADGKLPYSPEKHGHCTLFGGTHVAQARALRGSSPVAMVVRTGFYSAKGQLLRSILFPRQLDQGFVSDSLKFICIMLAGCIVLYAWAAVTLLAVGASYERLAVRFFDMITIAVPPALPACLTISMVFSISRLRKQGMYVTCPERIAVAGQLDLIAFDKTGTLTEQGLDLQGIVPIADGEAGELVEAADGVPEHLRPLLASCHGLALMENDHLVGDPLDQKLFQATHWQIHEGRGLEQESEPSESAPEIIAAAAADGALESSPPPPDGDTADDSFSHHGAAHTLVGPPDGSERHVILKRFEFSAVLQRNVVIVRSPGGGPLVVFAKGSPEAIRGLVAADSVPPDFDHILAQFTREGLRLLALAQGEVPADMPEHELTHVWSQQEVEEHVPLRLVGLAVMANPLRLDSAEVIEKLQAANIRTMMVTGDHLRTAISIAHRCGIMPEHKPVLLVEGRVGAAPPAGSGHDSGQPSRSLLISLLDLHGNITEITNTSVGGDNPAEVTTTSARVVATVSSSPNISSDLEPSSNNKPGGLSSLLGKLLQGEIEAAVTGQGFTSLLLIQQHQAQAISNSHSMDPPSLSSASVVVSASVSSSRSPSPAPASAALGSKSLLNGNGIRACCGATSAADCEDGKIQRPAAASSSPLPDEDLTRVLLLRTCVWARMSPDNKRDLMELLGSGKGDGLPCLGQTVGFCGDGANDCGALKSACIGVSLCEAEASVAAPLTSRQQTISSMVVVVAEGRCTLMATYQIFQFIIAYALVQAFETNLMYTFALDMGNYQYLMQDLFFTTVLASLMGFTQPRSKLSSSKPLRRVMSAPLLLSTLGQLLVVSLFQVLSLGVLRLQPGYVPTRGDSGLQQIVAPENTVTYLMALAQFIVLALVFNKGRPHRSPLWTNKGLSTALLLQTVFVIYSTWVPGAFNTEIQQLVDFHEFGGVFGVAARVELMLLMLANGACAFGVEGVVSVLLSRLR